MTVPGATANVKDLRVTAEAYDKSLELSGEPEHTSHGD